ncbi:MAG: hypothetical protein H0W34_05775 [Pyrinomonadaceae bacterium]|jgi:hypothetical protein|nr:hypothetical protein [Pyrinomonadaceae bacterium]
MCEKSPPPPSEAQATPSAPAKDKHDFLVALLKESRYGLIDFMFKQAAVLTLLIGWVVSSDKARDFIAGANIVQTIGACVVSLYSLLFVFWAWTYRQRSQSAYAHLLALGYMPKDFYATLHVTKRLAVSLVAIHATGCAVLIAFLYQIK